MSDKPNHPPDEQQIPVAEWLAEGRRRFGDDPKLWQFRCPVCGNIQTMQDFKQVGAEPQSVYQECIGRHLPSRASNLAGTPSKDGKKSPCDFAAYGLFQFGWKVINEAGKPVPVFPFADSTHPDLNPHDVADEAGAVNLAAGVSGEVTVAEAKAAPAGESADRSVYLPAFLEAKWNRSTNRIGEKVE